MQQTVTLLQVRGVIPSAPADASPAQSCERRFFLKSRCCPESSGRPQPPFPSRRAPPRASPA